MLSKLICKYLHNGMLERHEKLAMCKLIQKTLRDQNFILEIEEQKDRELKMYPPLKRCYRKEFSLPS